MNQEIEEGALFSDKSRQFLADLEENNNKRWFDNHKETYEEHILHPMKRLVLSLGPPLSKKLKGLRYEPRVNGSIFRINRDTRFSKNKTPYKTHTASFLWLGPEKKSLCPGIYFHFDRKELLLGGGILAFSPKGLENYRKFVDQKGEELVKALEKAEKAGFIIGGEKLKKVPRPFDPNHPRAELLKYKGLHGGKAFPPSKIKEENLVSWLLDLYPPTFDLVKVLEKALF